jgi:hypothetical protein
MALRQSEESKTNFLSNDKSYQQYRKILNSNIKDIPRYSRDKVTF